MSRRRTMEAILASEYVSIGELARLTGCRYSTLKHYTEEGMLPFEQEEENLTRRYRREQSVQLVEWIREQRKSGKSIPEMQRISCCSGILTGNEYYNKRMGTKVQISDFCPRYSIRGSGFQQRVRRPRLLL